MLIDPAGRVLLAQRPPGKHLAGMWEFPGGKLDRDELPIAGLARELREELDIQIEPTCATPLVQVPWRYGERALLLDAWCVRRWQGTPRSMEMQALQWLSPGDVDDRLLAPADREILRALPAALMQPTT